MAERRLAQTQRRGGAVASAAPVAAGTPAVAWSAANLPDQPVYQDQYIGGGTLAPDISAGDRHGSDDGEGLARSLQIDAVASVLFRDGGGAESNMVENGIVAKSQWETAAVRRVVARCLGAHREAPDAGRAEQGQGGVFTLEAARHALRRRMAGRQRPRRSQLPRHQPRALAAALLSADRSDAGPDHGMARALPICRSLPAAACPVSTTASRCPIFARWTDRPRPPARSGRRHRIGRWADNSSRLTTSTSPSVPSIDGTLAHVVEHRTHERRVAGLAASAFR